MVSPGNAWEVTSGLFRFGTAPVRDDTVIDGRHFTLSEREGTTRYTIRGAWESGKLLVTEFEIDRAEGTRRFGMGETVPPDLQDQLARLLRRVQPLVKRGGFFVEVSNDNRTLVAESQIDSEGRWKPGRFWIREAEQKRSYKRLEEILQDERARFRALIANRGLERVSLLDYKLELGRFPALDWGLLASFAAIAGVGGMANTLFSNYVRIKVGVWEPGWGRFPARSEVD